MARLKPEHLLENAPTVTVNRAIQVMDQGVKVHFAAFADAPAGCWDQCGLERYLRVDPSLQIWVTLRHVAQNVTIYRKAQWKRNMEPPHFMKDFLKGLMRILPDTTHSTVVKFVEKYFFSPEERIQIQVPGPALAYLWDKALPACTGLRIIPHGDLIDVDNQKGTREAFTAYSALDRIFSFKPKRIRILCCDMAGTWIEGKTEEECYELERQKKTPTPLDRWKHERHHMLELVKAGQKQFGTIVEWATP